MVMPKGASGGKRRVGGGGGGLPPTGGIQLNQFSMIPQQPSGIPDNATVSQVEQYIGGQQNESVAVFGNDRRLLTMTDGSQGEVTISGADLKKYGRDMRVMTHNHPIDLQLSTGDLIAATKLGNVSNNNFEELRAVSSTGNVYRALRPTSGQWPTTKEVEKAIQKNVKGAYEKAVKSRRGGATKEDAFQVYQDELSKRVAKDTGIRLRSSSQRGQQISLANLTQPLTETPVAKLRNITNPALLTNLSKDIMRSPVSEKPTTTARQQFGFGGDQGNALISGERQGAFPIFDARSAQSAVNLRGHARTEAGRQNIVERASQFAPDASRNAMLRDQARTVSLQNESALLRSERTGKPTAEARKQFGFYGTDVNANIPGEKPGAFPIFDVKSAKAAKVLSRFAKTPKGLESIQQRAEKLIQKGEPSIRLHNVSQTSGESRQQFERRLFNKPQENFGYFDAKGKKVLSFEGNENFVRIDKFAVAREGKRITTATHNHPSDYGLSTHDLMSASFDGQISNLKEFRATTRDQKIHSLTQGDRKNWASAGEVGERLIRNVDTSMKTANTEQARGTNTSDTYKSFQDTLVQKSARDLGYSYNVTKGGHLPKASESMNAMKTRMSDNVHLKSHLAGMQQNTFMYAANLKRQISAEANPFVTTLSKGAGFGGAAYAGFTAATTATGNPVVGAGVGLVSGIAGSRLGGEAAYLGLRAINAVRFKNAQTAQNTQKGKGLTLNNVSTFDAQSFENVSRRQPRQRVPQPEIRQPQQKTPLVNKALGVVGGYYGAKVTGKAADFITPSKGPLRIVTSPMKYIGMYYAAKEGYKAGKNAPGTAKEVARGVYTGEIGLTTVKNRASKGDLKKYSKQIANKATTTGSTGKSATSFYMKSGINPLSAFSTNREQRSAFWAVNPYTRKIPAYAAGIAGGRIAYEVANAAYGPLGGIAAAAVGGLASKMITERVAHTTSKRIAKMYSPDALQLQGTSSGYITSRTMYGGLRGGAVATREVMMDRRRQAKQERQQRQRITEAKNLIEQPTKTFNTNTAMGRFKQRQYHNQRANARALLSKIT